MWQGWGHVAGCGSMWQGLGHVAGAGDSGFWYMRYDI